MQFLRDPLLAFLVAGAAIFALDAWRSDGGDNVIRVGTLDVARLTDQWQAQMGRAPEPQELDGLINAHVREEMLVREALKMGLNNGDVIIRRRLAQKLTFLTEDLALLEPAAPEQLAAFFEANKERYRVPARFTFSHIYFSPDRRDAPQDDAQAAKGNVAEDNWRALGDPFMLRRTYAHASHADVRRDFGGAFAAALDNLEGQGWEGPVKSGYGFHLVRLERRSASRLPAFAEVERRVAVDFDAERRAEANERYHEALSRRYVVAIDR